MWVRLIPRATDFVPARIALPRLSLLGTACVETMQFYSNVEKFYVCCRARYRASAARSTCGPRSATIRYYVLPAELDCSGCGAASAGSANVGRESRETTTGCLLARPTRYQEVRRSAASRPSWSLALRPDLTGLGGLRPSSQSTFEENFSGIARGAIAEFSRSNQSLVGAESLSDSIAATPRKLPFGRLHSVVVANTRLPAASAHRVAGVRLCRKNSVSAL